MTSSRVLPFPKLSPLLRLNLYLRSRPRSPPLQRNTCPRQHPLHRPALPSPPPQPPRLRPALLFFRRKRPSRPSPRLLPSFPVRRPRPKHLLSPKTQASISRKCSASLNTISKSARPPPKETPKLITTSA